MMHSGWSRLRGHLPWVAVAVLGVGGVLPAALAATTMGTGGPVAAVPSVTHVVGFSIVPVSVRLGGEAWSAVTVTPAAVRTVTVQYRRAGTAAFTSASSGRTNALGRMDVGLKPVAAGTWQFRLVVPATATAGPAVTATRTVVASGTAAKTAITGFSSSAATLQRGASLGDAVALTPRAARNVLVQYRRAGTAFFATQSAGVASAAGAFTAVYRPASVGVWQYRLVVRANISATSAASPLRTITAIDTIPPASVTDVTTSSTDYVRTVVSWANPTTADFTGVRIRRAIGAVAPASPTAGVQVADTAKATKSFADTGLTPGQTYSYAVFAHDGAGNYAAAGKASATLKSVPTPVLKVGALGLAAPDVTVHALSNFDARGSQVAPGRTLTSAVLDFGDLSHKNFSGSPSGWHEEHSYSSGGLKTVTLTVTDNLGQHATTTVAVTVVAAVTATISNGPAAAGQPVTFTVTKTTPGGTAFTDYDVSWNGGATFVFGNGAPPGTLTHTFAAAGTYKVVFDAYNDADGFARSTITVTVTP